MFERVVIPFTKPRYERPEPDSNLYYSYASGDWRFSPGLESFGDTLGTGIGVGTGAYVGGTIGSMIAPGVGTLIGTGIGALVGYITSSIETPSGTTLFGEVMDAPQKSLMWGLTGIGSGFESAQYARTSEVLGVDTGVDLPLVGDVGALGVDVFTDPLTFVGPGLIRGAKNIALAKRVQALQKAGKIGAYTAAAAQMDAKIFAQASAGIKNSVNTIVKSGLSKTAKETAYRQLFTQLANQKNLNMFWRTTNPRLANAFRNINPRFGLRAMRGTLKEASRRFAGAAKYFDDIPTSGLGVVEEALGEAAMRAGREVLDVDNAGRNALVQRGNEWLGDADGFRNFANKVTGSAFKTVDDIPDDVLRDAANIMLDQKEVENFINNPPMHKTAEAAKLRRLVKQGKSAFGAKSNIETLAAMEKAYNALSNTPYRSMTEWGLSDIDMMKKSIRGVADVEAIATKGATVTDDALKYMAHGAMGKNTLEISDAALEKMIVDAAPDVIGQTIKSLDDLTDATRKTMYDHMSNLAADRTRFVVDAFDLGGGALDAVDMAGEGLVKGVPTEEILQAHASRFPVSDPTSGWGLGIRPTEELGASGLVLDAVEHGSRAYTEEFAMAMKNRLPGSRVGKVVGFSPIGIPKKLRNILGIATDGSSAIDNVIERFKLISNHYGQEIGPITDLVSDLMEKKLAGTLSVEDATALGPAKSKLREYTRNIKNIDDALEQLSKIKADPKLLAQYEEYVGRYRNLMDDFRNITKDQIGDRAEEVIDYSRRAMPVGVESNSMAGMFVGEWGAAKERVGYLTLRETDTFKIINNYVSGAVREKFTKPAIPLFSDAIKDAKSRAIAAMAIKPGEVIDYGRLTRLLNDGKIAEAVEYAKGFHELSRLTGGAHAYGYAKHAFWERYGLSGADVKAMSEHAQYTIGETLSAVSPNMAKNHAKAVATSIISSLGHARWLGGVMNTGLHIKQFLQTFHTAYKYGYASLGRAMKSMVTGDDEWKAAKAFLNRYHMPTAAMHSLVERGGRATQIAQNFMNSPLMLRGFSIMDRYWNRAIQVRAAMDKFGMKLAADGTVISVNATKLKKFLRTVDMPDVFGRMGGTWKSAGSLGKKGKLIMQMVDAKQYEEAAIEAVRTVLKQTNFDYSALGLHHKAARPIQRVLLQYQRWSANMLKTLWQWAKHDKPALIRYLTQWGALSAGVYALGGNITGWWGGGLTPTGSPQLKMALNAATVASGAVTGNYDQHWVQGAQSEILGTFDPRATHAARWGRYFDAMFNDWNMRKASGRLEAQGWGQSTMRAMGIPLSERPKEPKKKKSTTKTETKEQPRRRRRLFFK